MKKLNIGVKMKKIFLSVLFFLTVACVAYAGPWGTGGGGSGTTTINSIGDATADGVIDIGTYAILYELGTAGSFKIGSADVYFEFVESGGDYIFRMVDGGTGDIYQEFDLVFADQNASPSSVGEFLYDNTVAGFTGGLLAVYTNELKYIPLFAGDALPTVTGEIPQYNATNDEIEFVDSPKFESIAVADLSDTTTPSVLTVDETTNKCISNYKSTGADHVFTLVAAHLRGNVIFPVGDEFQVDVEPPSGVALYLNGTAMAADEHIVNDSDTLGSELVCYCANINGTLTWMCKSSSSDWVEATP